MDSHYRGHRDLIIMWLINYLLTFFVPVGSADGDFVWVGTGDYCYCNSCCDGNGDGDGHGNGNGDGDGNSDGDDHGYGDGDGHGHGHGVGNCNGDGNGDGDGHGHGDCHGDGHCDDDGHGHGHGNGHGDGHCDDDGHGHGHGNGHGDGHGHGDRGTNCFGISAPTGTSYPCDHYKRLCLMKFPCCTAFYPCHRCHNNNGECGRANQRKAKDATLLKCLVCNEEQKFTDASQHCVKCNVQFADYFCKICKNLTDLEKNPFHCDKCGICRVNGNRSFHCDDCGVCLDVSLRNNHVCSEGGAHESCIVCLQDAFFGCQILPCGHKIHRDCSRPMLRRGIYNCLRCNASFADLVHNR